MRKQILLTIISLLYTYSANCAAPATYVTLHQVQSDNVYKEVKAIALIRHLPSISFYAMNSGTVDFVSANTNQKIIRGEEIISISSEVSDTAISEAQTALDHAQANYKRDLKLYKQQYISEAKLEQSKRALKQAKSKLANTRRHAQDSKFTAPFSGVVGAINLHSGDQVKAGQYLASLIGNKETELSAYLPQTLSSKNEISAKLLLPSGKYITPTLKTRSEYVDKNTGNALAIFSLPYTPELIHDAYTNITLTTDRHKALIIPEKAIMIDDNGAHIFVVNNDKNSVQRLDIERGLRMPPMVEVISKEINETSVIVLNGAHKLQDGSAIIELVE